MTAYLQPGDKIHIAVGINETTSVQDANRQTRDQLKTFEKAYGAVGVSILTITGTPGLLAPVIVSVIREGVGSRFPRRSAEKLKLVDLEKDLPNHWTVPWQDPAGTTEPPPEKQFPPHGLQ